MRFSMLSGRYFFRPSWLVGRRLFAVAAGGMTYVRERRIIVVRGQPL
jgi:hypothetical protein